MKARQSDKARRLLADPQARRQLREFVMLTGPDRPDGRADDASVIAIGRSANDSDSIKVRPRVVPYKAA